MGARLKIRFSRLATRALILALLAYLLYAGPGIALSTKTGTTHLRVLGVETNIEAPEDLFYIDFAHQRLQTCDKITPYERSRLTSEAGFDVVGFVEESTHYLHTARNSEEQLRVIASRFDHQTWSNSWDQTAILQRDPRAREYLQLQTDLGHASLVLARYNRIIENGKRQESAALSAFKWRPDARREIEREPMRVMVRGFLPHTCFGTDQAQYGCVRGETLYRIHTVISPRIACRFEDKREQYAAVFWVRLLHRPDGSVEPRILEVEANGQELVRETYQELVLKKKLKVLAPDVTESLAVAGLDPFRTAMMWRRWVRDPGGRTPASFVPSQNGARLPSRPRG